MHGRWNHLRDVVKGSVIRDSVPLMGSSSPLQWGGAGLELRLPRSAAVQRLAPLSVGGRCFGEVGGWLERAAPPYNSYRARA